jgi:hypothetical protein
MRSGTDKKSRGRRSREEEGDGQRRSGTNPSICASVTHQYPISISSALGEEAATRGGKQKRRRCKTLVVVDANFAVFWEPVNNVSWH